MMVVVITWLVQCAWQNSVGSVWKRSVIFIIWGKDKKMFYLENFRKFYYCYINLEKHARFFKKYIFWILKIFTWFLVDMLYYLLLKITQKKIFQSIWMYFLGQKTLVKKEEDSMAIGNSCWSSSGYWLSSRHCRARHDYR